MLELFKRIVSILKSFRKKMVLSILALIMFITYFLITDPDMEVIKSLPFGTQLVLLIGMFFIGAMVIAFIETYTDIYTDEIAKDEKQIATIARQSSQGAGMVLIAKAIRILSYAIVMAAIVFSVNGII